jgi:outer membrane receptor protein involved in Fe transport
MSATISEYRPDNIGRDTVFTNVEPILTPSLMARLSATWHLSSELSVSTDARYVSASFVDLSNDPTMKLPSFVRLDMQVFYKVNDYNEVVASLNNLTDAFIVTNGGAGSLNGIAVPTYFVQAGRNFMVSFRWKF